MVNGKWGAVSSEGILDPFCLLFFLFFFFYCQYFVVDTTFFFLLAADDGTSFRHAITSITIGRRFLECLKGRAV